MGHRQNPFIRDEIPESQIRAGSQVSVPTYPAMMACRNNGILISVGMQPKFYHIWHNIKGIVETAIPDVSGEIILTDWTVLLDSFTLPRIQWHPGQL